MGTCLFQAGIWDSFASGLYCGDIDFKTLAMHGDTGLGTVNHVDGEMIALDGQFYCIKADGRAEIIPDDVCTPLAVVSSFQPLDFFKLEQVHSLTALDHALQQHIDAKNGFYMLKMTGYLNYIKFRSEHPQSKPIQPLHITLPYLETIFELHYLHATIIATYCPPYSDPMMITGFHYHFIDAEKTTGGHVYDLHIAQADVAIMPCTEIKLHVFPQSVNSSVTKVL